MAHADVRYLESKRTVDERARSRRVRDRLLDALPDAPAVVDVGAGTASMLRTLLAWGVRDGTYLGVDRAEPLVEWARTDLRTELAETYPVEPAAAGFTVAGLSATFTTGDVRDLPAAGCDLVVAQALLDLVPIGATLDAIERALDPGGLAYLPITFDGVSVFRPAHPDDRAVVEGYHDVIDDEPGRDSRAGRRLIEHLPDRDGELLAVDASDWIVRPAGDGYPADEAYFLDCILEFVDGALENGPVEATDWLAARRRQLDAGSLAYVAHGYDFLYRAPP